MLHFLRSVASLALVLIGAAGAQPAQAQDRVAFGLDWKAEAEYGGYYQALATGIYARHGLEVSIRQGGPQVNQAQLLLAGRLDFILSSNSYLVLNMVQERLPLVAVAAFFQKDPSILVAHPGQGNDSFEALRGKPIMIGADTRLGWWNFLRSRFGYTDAQIRPYTFNLAPFLANKAAIQQGYLGSEPYAIRTEAGFDPVILLLADAGFQGYGSLLTTRTDQARDRPDLVQRFVDASVEGWAAYLDGDPAPAHALIRRENPEMTDGLLAYGRDVLKARDIVRNGSATDGIGAMSEARWSAFFQSMQGQALYPADLAWRTAFTTRFLSPDTASPKGQ
jgi:NitT/TauT family transport system substrate-binding protein